MPGNGGSDRYVLPAETFRWDVTEKLSCEYADTGTSLQSVMSLQDMFPNERTQVIPAGRLRKVTGFFIVEVFGRCQ